MIGGYHAVRERDGEPGESDHIDSNLNDEIKEELGRAVRHRQFTSAANSRLGRKTTTDVPMGIVAVVHHHPER